jgi:hypothetical protein
MVCYCMKAIDEGHFQFVHHDVCAEMMEVGMSKFVKYRAMIVNNRVHLTHHNALECVTMFNKHKMKGRIRVLLRSYYR